LRTIDPTTKFKRDYKREMKGQYRATVEADLVALFDLLANDRPLDTRFRDHALTGNWANHRDCHIRPDLVLIYRKTEDERLILVRLGSHSELGL
jgi:mRNA interferase YafQ